MRITKLGKNAYRRFVDKEFRAFFIDFFGKKAGSEYYGAFSFREKKYLFGAWDKKKMAGAANLRISKGVASIGAFVVKKEYRRKGIGAKLIKKCEAVAKENSCVKIWLWTDHRMPAYKFYKEQNYIEEARLKKHWGGKDMCVMSKFL